MMCLGIPGKVVETYREHDVLMGRVDFSGVCKRVCLEHVPDVCPGDYVLVHVGFARSRIDEIRNGKIANYHPYPPTPWNASPRDIYGTPGPYEDAVQNTPIFEENGPDKFKGIDIMRAVRSFDPCLPYGVHIYLGNGRLLEVRRTPMFGVQR